MKKGGFIVRTALVFFLAAAVSVAGCATKGGTGALAGAGLGGLVGALAGSDGTATLIGAGVGAGLGYVVGNEMDKKDAAGRQTAHEDELRPLMGTTWQVDRIVPAPKEPFKSIIVSFKPDGTVVTTTTRPDGSVQSDTEKYRIVGSTLIVNKTDYIQNSKFSMEGDRLIIDSEKRSAVLQRVN